MMFSRWSRAVTYLSKASIQNNGINGRGYYVFSCQSYSKVAAATDAQCLLDSAEKRFAGAPQVNLNKMFWSKPCSLAVAADSPLWIEEPKYVGIRRIILKLMLFYSKQSKSIRGANMVNLNKMFWSKPCSLDAAADSPLWIEEPKYVGIRRIILKLMLFYSKQSKSIRGANVVYRRIISQVEKPAIYNVFSLEKTFKTTFSLLVLHTWLCLRRLKQEGAEGAELGQYLYEIYNHDVELRVSKAGVNLLLTKWMKELEKIFYGNIVAYDAALLPEAKQDELEKILWRNIFSDDGSPIPDDVALRTAQAMSRYVRREAACFSLTDKEALYSGNFMFTSLEIPWTNPDAVVRRK